MSSTVLHLESEEVFGYHKRLVDSPLGSNIDSHCLNKVNFFKLKIGDRVVKENKTSSLLTSKVGGALETPLYSPFLDMEKRYWRLNVLRYFILHDVSFKHNV
jgi:hypothetical protein